MDKIRIKNVGIEIILSSREGVLDFEVFGAQNMGLGMNLEIANFIPNLYLIHVIIRMLKMCSKLLKIQLWNYNSKSKLLGWIMQQAHLMEIQGSQKR